METIVIEKNTPILDLADSLREVLVARQASLDEHSGVAFTGTPVGQRLMPMPSEDGDFIIGVSWLVIVGKRAFTYIPNNEDIEYLEAISGEEMVGKSSDCLDVAKLFGEVPYRQVRKIARATGWTRKWTRKASKSQGLD